MTLNEILQNITILTNNSASPTGFAWVCIVLCGIACCIMIAWLICEIVNFGHTSVKIFAGFMATLFAASIIGGIDLQRRHAACWHSSKPIRQIQRRHNRRYVTVFQNK